MFRKGLILRHIRFSFLSLRKGVATSRRRRLLLEDSQRHQIFGQSSKRTSANSRGLTLASNRDKAFSKSSTTRRASDKLTAPAKDSISRARSTFAIGVDAPPTLSNTSRQNESHNRITLRIASLSLESFSA